MVEEGRREGREKWVWRREERNNRGRKKKGEMSLEEGGREERNECGGEKWAWREKRNLWEGGKKRKLSVKEEGKEGGEKWVGCEERNKCEGKNEERNKREGVSQKRERERERERREWVWRKRMMGEMYIMQGLVCKRRCNKRKKCEEWKRKRKRKKYLENSRDGLLKKLTHKTYLIGSRTVNKQHYM